jgi:hypothetical protein
MRNSLLKLCCVLGDTCTRREILRLRCEAQLVNAIWETIPLYCGNRMEHTDTLCGPQRFSVLKQVVHIITTVL